MTLIKQSTRSFVFTVEPQRPRRKTLQALTRVLAEGLRAYGESASFPVRKLTGTFGRLSMQ